MSSTSTSINKKFVLQVDFPFEGPFGDSMTAAMKGLAESIATESGLIWKIWTEDEEGKRAGGIYLFTNKADAERYREMHCQRLGSFGITNIDAKIFTVNAELSAIDRFPY